MSRTAFDATGIIFNTEACVNAILMVSFAPEKCKAVISLNNLFSPGNIRREGLVGTWKGFFIYGEGYEQELVGTRIAFTIDITEDDELVRGFCIDDETKQIFKDPVPIEGSFAEGVLRFYKSYPFTYDVDDVGNPFIAGYEKPASIQYTGVMHKKLFSNDPFFKGEWSIDGSFIDEFGQAQYYSASGGWRMDKTK